MLHTEYTRSYEKNKWLLPLMSILLVFFLIACKPAETLDVDACTASKKWDTQNKTLEKAKQGLKLGTTSDAEFRKVQRNVAYSEAEVKRLNNELEKTKTKIKDLGNVKFDNIAKVGSTLNKSVRFLFYEPLLL